jgi:hypothetical protein
MKLHRERAGSPERGFDRGQLNTPNPARRTGKARERHDSLILCELFSK